jgi:hypothetical protein
LLFVETGRDFYLSVRNIPEKIRDFLCDRCGRAYCDECVQQRLGIKWRQQVQVITSTLAVTGIFPRGPGTCSTCNEEKQVIRAIETHGSGFQVPAPRAFLGRPSMRLPDHVA